MDHRARRPFIVHPDDGRASGINHFIKQPHLGREVIVHVVVIIEVIAAKVGEASRHYARSFAAVLRQAMAARLKRNVADPLARQSAHIGEEGNDIGGGQAG